MKACERFKCVIKGREADRLPAIEWAPYWDLTVNRWNKEGMGIELKDTRDYLKIQRKFGLDGCIQTYFSPFTADTPKPAYHGAGLISNESDYEKFLSVIFPEPSLIHSKEHYEWLKKTQQSDGDTIHFFTVEGFFWFPRTLFGIEPHLYSFYDEPGLLHRINADNVKWIKKVFEFVGNTFKFDFMSIAEDMSYNNGPMLGKDAFDEFMLPYYKEIIPLLNKMDVPVFIDSDGDIDKAVEWYREAGAGGMFPLERQAGVDVASYILKCPDMVFLGHFDKMCMKFGRDAMKKEFERLLPSLVKGKVIPSVDHQTPPDVCIENYREYCSLLKEYAKKAYDIKYNR